MATGQTIGAILIAGPTTSGKSALALDLARRSRGVIVNADSMQVYRDLRVLTARPTPEDETAAPHRLYGHVDGGENYSVARYLRDAAAALTEARREGLLPIFAGGTGLYFKALLKGLSEIPPVPPEVRDRVRRESEGQPAEALHAALAARDPATADRLRPFDRLRVLRALEVLDATGRPLVSFQGRKQPGPLAGVETIRLFLAAERGELRRRIDARFAAMIEQGGVAEVEALRERDLDPMLPVMRAHGVPGLLAHLRGEISLGEAIARGQADTRHYAKRQFTWFRHQMPGWRWVAPEEARAVMLAEIAQTTQAGPS
jgi:tRNA dimethylallyltransferase